MIKWDFVSIIKELYSCTNKEFYYLLYNSFQVTNPLSTYSAANAIMQVRFFEIFKMSFMISSQG